MQNKKGIFTLIIAFLLILPLVLSAQTESLLQFYEEFYGWIDFGLYILIFVGITQEFMAIKFKKEAFGHEGLGSGAKAVSMGLGLVLAISLATWEVKVGFKLFQLAPLLIAILAILGILKLVGWLKSRNKKFDFGGLRNAAIYFLILVIIVYYFFPSFIYNYLPWSWVKRLIDGLIVLAIIIIILSFGMGRGEEPIGGVGGEKGNFLGNRKSDLAAIANMLRDRKERNRAYKLAQGEQNLKRLQLKYPRTEEILKHDLRQKEEERKRKLAKEIENERRRQIFVSIIPKYTHLFGKLELIGNNPRTYKVIAGQDVNLELYLENVVGDYTTSWEVNNHPPDLFYGKINSRTRRISIPTGELQEITDKDLLRKNMKGESIVGKYVWQVAIKENKTGKTASDEIAIIILRNPKLEEKQYKQLEKNLGKLEKEEFKNKYIKMGEAKYNGKEYAYASKNKKYKDACLLPLGEKVQLSCIPTGKFEDLAWFIRGYKDKGKGKFINRKGKNISYTFDSALKSGLYEIVIRGYKKKYNDKEEQGIYSELYNNIYLKKKTKPEEISFELFDGSRKIGGYPNYKLIASTNHKIKIKLPDDEINTKIISLVSTNPDYPLPQDKNGNYSFKTSWRLGEKIDLILHMTTVDDFKYEEKIIIPLKIEIISFEEGTQQIGATASNKPTQQPTQSQDNILILNIKEALKSGDNRSVIELDISKSSDLRDFPYIDTRSKIIIQPKVVSPIKDVEIRWIEKRKGGKSASHDLTINDPYIVESDKEDIIEIQCELISNGKIIKLNNFSQDLIEFKIVFENKLNKIYQKIYGLLLEEYAPPKEDTIEGGFDIEKKYYIDHLIINLGNLENLEKRDPEGKFKEVIIKHLFNIEKEIENGKKVEVRNGLIILEEEIKNGLNEISAILNQNKDILPKDAIIFLEGEIKKIDEGCNEISKICNEILPKADKIRSLDDLNKMGKEAYKNINNILKNEKAWIAKLNKIIKEREEIIKEIKGTKPGSAYTLSNLLKLLKLSSK